MPLTSGFVNSICSLRGLYSHTYLIPPRDKVRHRPPGHVVQHSVDAGCGPVFSVRTLGRKHKQKEQRRTQDRPDACMVSKRQDASLQTLKEVTGVLAT
jgi:hypothetical protein